MSKFETILPNTPEHIALRDGVDANPKAPQMDYNELAEHYNKAAVGAIILLTELPPKYMPRNLTLNLVNRGLRAKIDFRTRRLNTGPDGAAYPADSRPIGIIKLSDKKAMMLGS